MRIRNVRREDIDAFVKVYEEAYKGLEEYAYTKRRDIRNYFKWLYSRDKDGFMIVEDDDRAVGFVACDTNWVSIFERKKVGEIHEIFVLPEYRGKGIGTELMRLAIKYAQKKGRNVAELWVGRKNYRARKFYVKLGFKEVGEWGKWIRMVKVI